MVTARRTILCCLLAAAFPAACSKLLGADGDYVEATGDAASPPDAKNDQLDASNDSADADADATEDTDASQEAAADADADAAAPCDVYAQAFCAFRDASGCCGTVDMAQCVQFERTRCEAKIDTDAGSDLLAACLGKLNSLESVANSLCLLNNGAHVQVSKVLKPCIALHSGTVAQNVPCTHDFECEQPPDPDQVAVCAGGGACAWVQFFDAGSVCSGGAAVACELGYYCGPDIDAGKVICLPQVAPGESCNPADYANCQDFYTCGDAGVCVQGAPTGATCTDPKECQSQFCVSQHCAAPLPLFSGPECGDGGT
jgi:hypothetical protein